jgi:hypothetical protein
MADAFREGALAGKAVFIAGGSSGINLGIAERFADLGAKLAILSRSQDKIDAAVAGLTKRGARAIGIAADVRDYPAIDAALAEAASKFGPLDSVIAGQAGNFLAPVVGLSANGFKSVIDIDLIGTFNVFRASWDHLRKPGASLIAITAPQAVKVMPFQAHACAAKAGVNMLCKCLALEWGPAGVRVNAISPGPIEGTEGMARLSPKGESDAALKKRVALGRYGGKREIADMAAFLLSDASAYITGAVLNVDGGMELGDASADCLTVPRRT